MAAKKRVLGLLRKVQVSTSVEMVQAMRAAKDRLVDMTRAVAGSSDILKEAFRRAYFGKVSGVYDLLAKELDTKLKASINEVATISRASAFEDMDRKPPRVLAWDDERMEGYWRMVAPENAPSLAGVFTNKMAAEDLRGLRSAVVQVFRTADLEALTAKQRIKALQDAWDTAAGNKSATRFIDRRGTEWTNARYLQMLVRTTQQRIARESYIDTIVQNGDDLMRVQAAGDNCEICDAWDGIILSVSGKDERFPSYEDALEAGWAHPNCVPGDTLVASGGVLGAFRFRFSGDLIRIMQSGGASLRVAPNHPVLTGAGWIAAKDVKKGDKVFNTAWRERMPLSNPNVNETPSRIDQLFMAFSDAPGVTSVQMPISTEHFHGDAVCGNGNVDVVLSDRVLLAHFEPGGADGVGRLLFRRSNVAQNDGTGFRNLRAMLKRVGLATNRRMRRLCPLHASLGSSGGMPSGEAFPWAAQGNTSDLDNGGESGAIDAGFLANGKDVFAGLVAADDVVSVERERFDGHLYDLLTVEGCYLAGDNKAITIVSNCDCQLERIDEDVDEDATKAQADTQNPDDWADIDALEKYREEAGMPTPRGRDDFDFAQEFAKEFRA